MRKYETAIILSTSLSEKEIEKELAKVQETISEEEGTYLKTDSWGRRQLAYPIKKQTEGVYFFLKWDGEERVTTGIDKLLKINENCLRYLTLRLDGSMPDVVHVPSPETAPSPRTLRTEPEAPAAEAAPSAPEVEEEPPVPAVEEEPLVPAVEEEAPASEEKIQAAVSEEEPASVEEEEPADEEEETP